MTDIASIAPPLKWGESFSFEECPPAKNLFQLSVLLTGQSDYRLVDELNSHLDNSTAYEHRFSQAVYHLAEICLRVGSVAKNTLKLQDIYQKDTQTSSLGAFFMSLFSFGTYQEYHLPNCTFNIQTPLHRERYVFCKQNIFYFAENIATAIVHACQKTPIYSVQPDRFKNLGTYLVYAEDTQVPLSNLQTYSWKLRDIWNQQMKGNFCKTTTDEFWKNFHCSNEKNNDPLPQNQNLAYWYEHIFPHTIEKKDVYNSFIKTQIQDEMNLRKSVVTDFINRSSRYFSNITIYLNEEATALAQIRLSNQIAEQIFSFKNDLVLLYEVFLHNRNTKNWHALHEKAAEAKQFLIDHNMIEQYSDINQFISNLLSIFEPAKDDL